MQNFCEFCGNKLINPNAVVCPNCGADLKNTEIPAYEVPNKQKSPGLAAVLSFLICGLGQMYIGDIGRGVIFLIITLIIGILTAGIGGIIMLILVIYDAYKSAILYNEGKPRKFLNF
jgi:TM2 domain-containing membrane protein YozV